MSGPELSVVLSTPDTWQSFALTLRYLRAQTAAKSIELVMAGPDRAALDAPGVEAAFWGIRKVDVGPVTSIARANAAAVRHATAPVVALAEDHCFPEPEWAAALLEAHRSGKWAAVGPAMRNANPATVVSWCDFVIGYGPWMAPLPAGTMPFLPGHNCSYRRSILLEYGDRLEDMLDSETVMHLDLGSRGHGLYLEPAARAAHTNFALASSWFPVQFYAGRVFGAARARDWPLAKRLFYAAASPLIPAVRLARCLAYLARPGRPRWLALKIAPMLALGLAVDGCGQFAGYLLGFGNAREKIARYEFHRFRHVPESDRRRAEEEAPR